MKAHSKDEGKVSFWCLACCRRARAEEAQCGCGKPGAQNVGAHDDVEFHSIRVRRQLLREALRDTEAKTAGYYFFIPFNEETLRMTQDLDAVWISACDCEQICEGGPGHCARPFIHQLGDELWCEACAAEPLLRCCEPCTTAARTRRREETRMPGKRDKRHKPSLVAHHRLPSHFLGTAARSRKGERRYRPRISPKEVVGMVA